MLPLGEPRLRAVQDENIPEILKELDQWVVWRAGAIKDTGKFDKVPVDPTTGRAISAVDPLNWLPYEHALGAHRRGMGTGIGIALSADHPLLIDGERLYLTALDFDHCRERLGDIRALWLRLGKPYVEDSPSGKGLRMFGLSREPLRGGNAGEGREMYSGARFVTVTGRGARGSIRDVSDGLAALEREWFPTRHQSPAAASKMPIAASIPLTLENVRPVLAMLDHISPDLPYEDWRDIVWSLASTGWPCASLIAHTWSRRAPHRYDARAVDDLLACFDPSRGVTLGTLWHHARTNGYKRSPAPTRLIQQSPTKLLNLAELLALPPTPYIIRDLLPARGLTAIYGPPGSGKSFVTMDLALSVASGQSAWFGRRLTTTAVAYLALEGQGGIANRIRAWLAHTGLPMPSNFRFWIEQFSLLDPQEAESLGQVIREQLGSGAITVIDTLSQATPGGDENSSIDMTKAIRNADVVGGIVEGPVLLVHHSGKDLGKGLRGHTSLLGAVVASIEVANTGGNRSFTIRKNKDGPDGQSSYFELVSYAVGQDQWGDEIRSCAVRQLLTKPPAPLPRLTGKHQLAIVAALRSAIATAGGPIDWDFAVACGASALIALPNGRRATTARETLARLRKSGHVLLNEDGVSLS